MRLMNWCSAEPQMVRGYMGVSCACLAVLMLLTFSCSKKEVTSTNCKADEVKKDGECVKKAASNNPSREAIDPNAVGDTVSTSVVKYDADSGVFSVSLANLALTQGEQDRLSASYKVYFMTKSQTWLEEDGILQAVRKKTVIGTGSDAENKSPDCTVLPDGNGLVQRKNLPAIIEKVGDDVTIKFVKSFGVSKLERDDDKSLRRLKRWLGLNSYQMDDIRVSAGVSGLVSSDDLAVHMGYWQKEIKHYGLEDNDDKHKELCFNKLHAKQDSSLNDKEPSSSAKIYPYKAVKLSEVGVKEAGDTKPYNYEYTFKKSNDEYTYTLQQRIEFKKSGNNSSIRKTSNNEALRLSLPAAAYLINSSPEHRDTFTGRAAPSEEEFIDTMSALVRALAE